MHDALVAADIDRSMGKKKGQEDEEALGWKSRRSLETRRRAKACARWDTAPVPSVLRAAKLNSNRKFCGSRRVDLNSARLELE